MKFNKKWTPKVLRKILREFKQTKGTRVLCGASEEFRSLWHEHFLQIRKLALSWIKENKIRYAHVSLDSDVYSYLFYTNGLRSHRKARIEFLKYEIKRLEEKEFNKVWTAETLQDVLNEFVNDPRERFICYASPVFKELWKTYRSRIKKVARKYLADQQMHKDVKVSTERGKDAPLFNDDFNRSVRIEFLKYEIKRLTNAKRTKISPKRHTRIRK